MVLNYKQIKTSRTNRLKTRNVRERFQVHRTCKPSIPPSTLLLTPRPHITARYDCEVLITWLIDKIAKTDLEKEMDETPLIVTIKHRQLGDDDLLLSMRLFHATPHVLGQEPPQVKT